MGINNLSAFLRKQCPEILEEVYLTEYAYKKIAIDVSLYLFKYKKVSGDNWLCCFINLVSCLRKNDIHCVFIYDGEAPPEKAEERKRRRMQKEKDDLRTFNLGEDLERYHEEGIITPLMREISGKKKPVKSLLRKLPVKEGVDINFLEERLYKMKAQGIDICGEDFEKTKELCDILGVPYIQANGEAETLCCHLCIHGLVDAVLSEDTDVLAYGTPVFLRKINIQESTCEEIRNENLLQSLELSKDQFTDFCIMCGTDYNKNIPDIGTVRSYRLMLIHRSLENVSEKMDTSILNYQRGRELFSTPDDLNYTIPFCKRPNMKDLQKFIEENNCRINYERLNINFAPRKIVFYSEDNNDI